MKWKKRVFKLNSLILEPILSRIQIKKQLHPQTQCQRIGLSGNTFIEYLSYVTEMYPRQLENLRCIEELFKEYFQKDHQDRLEDNTLSIFS